MGSINLDLTGSDLVAQRKKALCLLEQVKRQEREWVTVPVYFTRNGRRGVRFIKEYKRWAFPWEYCLGTA